jgi:hypothetical protein
LRKDQYVIKEAYRQPVVFKSVTHSKFYTPLDEKITFDENGFCVPQGISFINPTVCSAVLCNYSKLKMDSYSNFEKDTYFFMEAFDELCTIALKDYPLYDKIVEMKIDGRQNVEIQ